MYSEKRAVFRTCQTRAPTGLVVAAASRNMKKERGCVPRLSEPKASVHVEKGLRRPGCLGRENKDGGHEGKQEKLERQRRSNHFGRIAHCGSTLYAA